MLPCRPLPIALFALAVFTLACDRQTVEPKAPRSQTPTDAPRATACPTPFMSVPPSSCQGVSATYGLSAEDPAEWGFGAGTRTLWFGRLMCADGSMPSVEHQESLNDVALSSSLAGEP